MSSYFKYVAIVSIILISAAAFFAGVYFRSFASKAIITTPSQVRSEYIAAKFEEEIWCRYSNIFANLAGQKVSEWSSDKYFSQLDKISRTMLSMVPADNISLYTAKGEKFFSLSGKDPVFFDNDNFTQNAIMNAAAGQQGARLVPSMGMSDNSGGLTKGSFVQVYVPISTAHCKSVKPSANVSAVMEVFTDVTISWKELWFFQLIVTAGIIFTFIMLYFALFLTSRKAEKIINKQHEEKLTLEKAKTRAEMQNQEKSMFLANVSHELRTPLNAIIGFSEIIKDEVMGAVGHPQYKEYINDINSSGVHLLSLINDILDYSKAEAKKLELESIDVDLTKIAHSCMRLVEPRALEAKVNLIEKVPEHHVILSADPKRMKQVILNLLSNSVKFTAEGGEVTLIINEDQLKGEVELIVMDNGIGIADKDLSKALAPFGQIDSSLSRRYEGTGLGLPLTKKLTDIMGGRFDIKSQVGLGTTVTLTFPIKSEKSKQEGKKGF